MLFNFMTNLGPNAQTYLLAGEVFPTAIRGKGAGFAAAFAKIGAVTTAFLFPILLDTIGTQSLLYCLIVTSLLGRRGYLALPNRDNRGEPRESAQRNSMTGAIRASVPCKGKAP
jgi:nitrate/nitrite transporter NarK